MPVDIPGTKTPMTPKVEHAIIVVSAVLGIVLFILYVRGKSAAAAAGQGAIGAGAGPNLSGVGGGTSSGGSGGVDLSGLDAELQAFQTNITQLAANQQNLATALGNLSNQITNTSTAPEVPGLQLDLSVAGGGQSGYAYGYGQGHAGRNDSLFGGSGPGGWNIGFGGGGSSESHSVDAQEAHQTQYTQSLKFNESGLSSADLAAALAEFGGLVSTAQTNAAASSTYNPNPWFNPAGQGNAKNLSGGAIIVNTTGKPFGQ